MQHSTARLGGLGLSLGVVGLSHACASPMRFRVSASNPKILPGIHYPRTGNWQRSETLANPEVVTTDIPFLAHRAKESSHGVYPSSRYA